MLVNEALAQKRLLIYLDNAGGLRDEWAKTCGHEVIAQLLIAWTDLKGLVSCGATGAIKPAALNKKLQDCKFSDACDKLIVRIGLSAIANHGAPIFNVATSDGDFWDPLNGAEKGNSSAPVASALAEHKVISTLLKDFLLAISAAGAA